MKAEEEALFFYTCFSRNSILLKGFVCWFTSASSARGWERWISCPCLRPVYFASFALCSSALSTQSLPVWADLNASSSWLFWGGSLKPIFPLFWRDAATSKLSSQGGSSEIRQRGISQVLGEKWIAWMLQKLSFTVFPLKEDWVWVLWCIFWARTSCSPAFPSVNLTSTDVSLPQPER